MGAISFHYDDPNLYGRQTSNDTVASPESVPIHLKRQVKITV